MSKASKMHLEEICLNAWPAVRQLHLDGWILRFAGGMTRRANSVIPICKGYKQIHQKIKTCQQIYASLNQKCYFKITSMTEPADLDQILLDTGFEKVAHSIVLSRPIVASNLKLTDVILNESNTTEWLAGIQQQRNWDENQIRQFGSITQYIVGRTARCLILRDNKPVALGLGVLQEEYLSLSHIIVDPAWRRMGLATMLIDRLQNWAHGHGCTTSLLTVESQNRDACKLYDELDFKQEAEYHYRVEGS